MKIRKANQDDVEVLVSIIRASFKTVADSFNLTQENCPRHPSNCTRDWIGAALDQGVHCFILETDKGPVGCVALEQAGPDVCYMERLAVLPDLRNQGLGRALADFALKQAKTLGCKRVEIGIIAEQLDLKDWYAKIGFTDNGEKEFPHLPFRVAFMVYALS
ncbi:GNAT family N-acetyltransferase [Desulfatibacillum aliphaticivorans]|uniref:GNAT family N-acetyltransferase n=1 Tax=Desulfatibacillum aliphaticivorans TaxID=218208 RepID=UPI0004108A4A|nr:GNAT family N-acetyltransferase [Desulfatibacillum aliphaticivorans]